MKTKIYVLKCPSGHIRYVGKTIKTLDFRLKQHLRTAKNKTHFHHRDNWLRAVLEAGQNPIIEMVEEVDGNGSKEEIALIFLLKNQGIDLINSTIGGEGVVGFKHSQKTKDAWSKKRRGVPTGRPISPKAKAKLLAHNTGRIVSAETREKIASKLRGIPLSQETKQKLSIILKQRIFTPEHRKNLKKAWEVRRKKSTAAEMPRPPLFLV